MKVAGNRGAFFRMSRSKHLTENEKMDIAAACEVVTGQPIPRTFEARRPGDPPRLVADATKLKNRLGWVPEYTDIRDIVTTAWAWHQAHLHGYGTLAGNTTS